MLLKFTDFMFYAIFFILSLYVILHIIYIVHFLIKPTLQKPINYQPVSILIAVRNEAKNLPNLLNSLLYQNYPKELMEVIFGNDDSEDNSLDILKE